MTGFPRLAALAVVLDATAARVLLVQRRNPPDAGLWGFPGGHVEPGETALAADVRELFEETGIKAEKPLLFATYDPPGREDSPGSPSSFLSVFKVKADRDAVAVAADDAASVGWYTAEEIAKLPAPDSVRECIARLEAERMGISA